MMPIVLLSKITRGLTRSPRFTDHLAPTQDSGLTPELRATISLEDLPEGFI